MPPLDHSLSSVFSFLRPFPRMAPEQHYQVCALTAAVVQHLLQLFCLYLGSYRVRRALQVKSGFSYVASQRAWQRPRESPFEQPFNVSYPKS